MIKAFTLTALAILLSACAAPTQAPTPTPDPVALFGSIAEDGLQCLEENNVPNPTVSYDVTQTQSLVSPLAGIIRVTDAKHAGTNPDGTEIMVQRVFELNYLFQGGSWVPTEVKEIQGDLASETDPVNLCFP